MKQNNKRERKFFPYPDNQLGEPQKKFSETFSAIPMIIDHFKTLTYEEKNKTNEEHFLHH